MNDMKRSSSIRLKFLKNQANTKQHLEAELLLFENYSHSSSTLSSKIMEHSKKTSKRTNTLFFISLRVNWVEAQYA